MTNKEQKSNYNEPEYTGNDWANERLATDKEQIEEMTSIINDEKDVCVRMQGLMDCKYCSCKNENGECGFAEYISRTFFAEGCRMRTTEKTSAVQWHKVADGDLPKKYKEVLLLDENDDYYIGSYDKDFRNFYIDIGFYMDEDEIIAWTELPTYKE